MAYANLLVHHGPYLGTTYEDAKDALERVLALVPDCAAAWDHLVWVTVAMGDTTAALRAAIEAARTFGAGTQMMALRARLSQFRAEVLHSGLPPPDSLERSVDLILSEPPGLAIAVASGLVADGASAAQIGFNRAVRARLPSREVTVALHRDEALAWAARGARDSTLVALVRWTRMSAEPDAVLGPYRLAVAGVALEAIPPAEAVRWRPPADGAPGRDAEAARLLTWHEAIPGASLIQAWQRSVGALSQLERTEIAEAMGQPERAQRHYARLLAQYDLPVPALRPRLARAETALARLAAGAER